ncbi:hypothetical protein N431DRAFT_338054 [Stipitochalara longipes BDJ]|nr:hypothetical protein N431DRAFT_338054 [Stipitochalara longipes BDJ]
MAPSSNPRGEVEMAVSYLFFALATFALSMRLVSRLVILKNGGLDEAAIVVSYVTIFISTANCHLEVRYGEGKHFDVVSLQDFQMSLKSLWSSIAFYNLSLYLTKTSILLQYLRIFTNRIRVVCWCTLAAITMWGLYTILSMIFACLPVSAFWTGDPHARCQSRQFLWFFHSSVNIVTDLVILTLPMPILKSLRLPPKQKVALMIIFALGGFVCLVSVLRLQSLYVISVSKDPTWDNVPTSICSNIEVYLGIICASLPTIKPILERLFPNAMARSRSGGDSLPTYTLRSHQHNTIGGGSFRLDDVDVKRQTVTRVEGNERPTTWLKDSSDEDLGKDIFVTTSMRQDVESRGEGGSEMDLIFQRP